MIPDRLVPSLRRLLEVAEGTEDVGIVGVAPPHQLQQVAEQRIVPGPGLAEPQLRPHQLPIVLRKHRLVGVEPGLDRLVGRQRREGLGQTAQIEVADVRLVVERVAPLMVGMVADEGGIVGFQEPERAVIEGHPQDGHVVAVHDAVREAHRLPLGDQASRADRRLVVEACVGIRTAHQLGEMLREHVVRQGLEVVELPSPVEELEVAEPDMRRREAQQRGAGLDLLAQHLFLAPHHTQGARRGNAQPVHGLAAEILPDAGAQDGAAVVVAGEGREARALEMQVPLLAPAGADLAQ